MSIPLTGENLLSIVLVVGIYVECVCVILEYLPEGRLWAFDLINKGSQFENEMIVGIFVFGTVHRIYNKRN